MRVGAVDIVFLEVEFWWWWWLIRGGFGLGRENLVGEYVKSG